MAPAILDWHVQSIVFFPNLTEEKEHDLSSPLSQRGLNCLTKDAKSLFFTEPW